MRLVVDRSADRSPSLAFKYVDDYEREAAAVAVMEESLFGA
jgi:hypothetical protein